MKPTTKTMTTLDTNKDVLIALVDQGIAASPQGKPIALRPRPKFKKDENDGKTFENQT